MNHSRLQSLQSSVLKMWRQIRSLCEGESVHTCIIISYTLVTLSTMFVAFQVNVLGVIILRRRACSQSARLTRPSKAQDVPSGNCQSFRSEAIFHGGISLHNVSSLSHSSNVNDSRISESVRQLASWLQIDYVCSILKCTRKLSSV